MGRTSRGRMEKLLTIRCSAMEYERIRQRAEEAGLPTAEWARRTLLGDTSHGAGGDASPEVLDDASPRGGDDASG